MGSTSGKGWTYICFDDGLPDPRNELCQSNFDAKRIAAVSKFLKNNDL